MHQNDPRSNPWISLFKVLSGNLNSSMSRNLSELEKVLILLLMQVSLDAFFWPLNCYTSRKVRYKTILLF